jgi:endoglucanase
VAAGAIAVAGPGAWDRPFAGRWLSDTATAGASARGFLHRYVDRNGRVVRRDQGGDTVSEGQAYAMLLAVADGDRRRFDLVWRWTRKHLQRRDGSLSSAWRDGRVQDAQPASDADLDAARALLVASRRFHRPSYRGDALGIGRAVLGRQTTRAADKLVLVAGPWARKEAIVNPSYFSPRAYAELRTASGDRRWSKVAFSSVRVSRRLLEGKPPLPPNWARVRPYGVEPIATPGSGEPPAYGYDAVRLPLRLAEACDKGARRLAARPWPFLRRQARQRVAPVYALDGAPTADGEHPAGLVGAAGAATASGDGRAARELLDRADKANRAAPTYYGAALSALGRVMLTTDLLGRC